MHIISKKRLREFWTLRSEAEIPLRSWYKVASRAHWNSFAAIRETYPSADKVGKFIVFNIGGNKFRLVVTARMDHGCLYVRSVLTHAEYDKGNWKEDS